MIKKILLSFFIAFITAELLTGIYIYISAHKIIYLSEASKPLVVEDSAVGEVTNFRIHPYLGYMLKPGISLAQYLTPERIKLLYELGDNPNWLKVTTNNYGYFSNYNYPYVASSDDELIIGVFGGSVAHWFAVQGAEKLAAELVKRGVVNKKKLTILNFAAGGYKQPQTLIALAYFLSIGQKFDFVLNLDGFNESALADKNLEAGVSPFMPSVQHINAMANLLGTENLNSEYLKTVVSLVDNKDAAEKWLLRRDRAMFSLSYFIYDLIARIKSKLADGDRLEADRLLKSRQHNIADAIWLVAENDSFVNLIARISETWVRSSLLMQSTCAARGVEYLHVLQPNQYVSRKIFGELEKKIALSDNPPYRRESILLGYKNFQLGSQELLKRSINYFDATAIFDDTKKIVFSDNCCHLNQLGNDILAENIAKFVSESLADN